MILLYSVASVYIKDVLHEVIVYYYQLHIPIGGGVDYTSGPYPVMFTAGQTDATFEVPINDDSILEYNESFVLTINSSSLPDGVNYGNPGEAAVIIVDNDCML